MERRKQPRFDVVHAVQVTVLDEPPVKLEGQVVNVSGSGFRLLASGKIRIGAAVRVDMADAMMLGEVCYCREDDAGNFEVGLESQQILTHTSDISQLMRRLSGNSGREREEPELEVAENSKSRHGILSGHGILSDG